jgi:hypothetical protein
MKIAEINVGLSSKTLGEKITQYAALNWLRAHGFRVLAHRLQASESEDGAELCLACKVELPDDWQAKLASVADELGQDCIAVVGFVGHAPYDTFIPSLWVTPSV